MASGAAKRQFRDEGGVATFFLLDGGMDDTDGDGDWCALPMFDLVAATVD